MEYVCVCKRWVGIPFLLNGFQVGFAVVACGREDQCDAVHRHRHPSHHRAKTVVQGYGHAYPYSRLIEKIGKKTILKIWTCYHQTKTDTQTYSSVITHPQTNEEGVVYNIVVRESSTLWTSCGSLKQIKQKPGSRGRPRSCRFLRERLSPRERLMATDVNWMLMGSSKDSLLCRSISSLWCRLSPAWITSSTWSIPGCLLSVTITIRRSGNLGRPGSIFICCRRTW